MPKELEFVFSFVHRVISSTAFGFIIEDYSLMEFLYSFIVAFGFSIRPHIIFSFF